MAPPAEKKVKTGFFSSTRHILYVVAFSLIFALTVAELGLVSQQLHNGGNQASHYPTKEYKNDLGILLFNCIFTLLILIGHKYLNLIMGAFFLFCSAIFWGTGAGIIFQVSPFKVYTCGKPAEFFAANWAPFASQCSRVVAIEGIAWALFGLTTILVLGIVFVDALSFKVQRNEFYTASEKGVQV
ncbi:hypothetical protein T439DRAFT_347723 [Meredithblackwellia eburnea MCA 4105]